MAEDKEPVKEVIFERTYDAPIEKVWEAWTDPAKLEAWWGPDNVSISECRVDLRVGGEFYIVMEAGPGLGEFQGILWPMQATYTRVEEPSELFYEARAWTEGDKESTTIHQRTELTLEDFNGKTKMTLKATILSVGPKAGMAVEGMQYGYNQQFDKLVRFISRD